MFRGFGQRLYSSFNRFSQNKPPDYVTRMLISANLGVYAGWLFLNPSFMQRHFVMSEFNTIYQQRYYTIFTSSVSHYNTWHLAVNMLGLWFFGRHMELIWGGSALLKLYIAGAFGGFAGLYWKNKRGRRRWAIPNVLGASAATSAIFTFFVLTDPWATVVFFIFPMPAILAGILMLGLSSAQGDGEVANSGHLGGAAAGGICYFARKVLFRF